MFFQIVRSCASHLRSPICFMSSFTQSCHVFLPLPLFRTHTITKSLPIFTQSSTDLRSMWPNYSSLPRLNTSTISSTPNLVLFTTVLLFITVRLFTTVLLFTTVQVFTTVLLFTTILLFTTVLLFTTSLLFTIVLLWWSDAVAPSLHFGQCYTAKPAEHIRLELVQFIPDNLTIKLHIFKVHLPDLQHAHVTQTNLMQTQHSQVSDAIR